MFYSKKDLVMRSMHYQSFLDKQMLFFTINKSKIYKAYLNSVYETVLTLKQYNIVSNKKHIKKNVQ